MDEPEVCISKRDGSGVVRVFDVPLLKVHDMLVYWREIYSKAQEYKASLTDKRNANEDDDEDDEAALTDLEDAFHRDVTAKVCSMFIQFAPLGASIVATQYCYDKLAKTMAWNPHDHVDMVVQDTGVSMNVVYLLYTLGAVWIRMDDTYTVTSIEGVGGAGKSTLLDAIRAAFDSDVYSSIFPVLRGNDSQFWAASIFKDDRQCLVPGVFPFVAAEAPDRHDNCGILVSPPPPPPPRLPRNTSNSLLATRASPKSRSNPKESMRSGDVCVLDP
jgi:hypothetical protein